MRQAQLECGDGRRHDHLPERRDAHSLPVDDADERGVRGRVVRACADVAAVHRQTELDCLEGQIARTLFHGTAGIHHVVKSKWLDRVPFHEGKFLPSYRKIIIISSYSNVLDII